MSRVFDNELVLRVRIAVIERLHWTGPHVTDAVLSAIAAVPYRGDPNTYLNDVVPRITSTYETAMHPRLDSNADATEKFRRDIEAFERMKTR
jgi:hypothetical protein